VLYLKQWRAVRGFISTHELARLSGLHRNSVVNIEKYGQVPDQENVKKLADALRLRIADLYINPFDEIVEKYPLKRRR
jgi:DNA-binding XRE family transcriptional regulator